MMRTIFMSTKNTKSFLKIVKFLILGSLLIVLCSCREEVVHLKSELEANRVMLGLRLEGINARKNYVAKEWVIDVPKKRLTDALRILEDKRVFRNDVEDDLDSSSSEMFTSRQEKEAKTNKIIAKHISRTLRIMPKVLDARVHIYQQTMDSFTFDSQKDKRSASVLLILEKEHAVTNEQVKNIVSQGAGLEKEAVSVVFVESQDEIDKASQEVQEKIKDTGLTNEADSDNEYPFYLKAKENAYLSLGAISLGVILLIIVFKKIKNKRKKLRESGIIDSLIQEEEALNEQR